MKHRGEGFQKPSRSLTEKREVGLGMAKSDNVTVTCKCGWVYTHTRQKVREDAVDRHFAKKHNGRGIRL